MAQNSQHKAPIPTPLYILLAISIGLCAFFFWIGTVCVRLWYYKGALGPLPQRFVIIPHHRKKKLQQQQLAAQNNNRNTVFPFDHIAETPSNPFSDEFATPESLPYFTTIPAIKVEDTNDDFDDAFADDFEDPAQVRKYIAEERRISRLPAFDQDDCGDGSEFTDVPYASKPIEKSRPNLLSETKMYLELGLDKANDLTKWLTIDNSYIEQHETRTLLLDRHHAQCIQIQTDGEAACEELLEKVVLHLCTHYPDIFTTIIKHRRKHIRNELIGEEYCIARPFEYDPLELCARLAAEDFCVFVRDDFTMRWYLQASATLFPSGWSMLHHIGKSLSAIINNVHAPMLLWSSFPSILPLLHTPSSLLTHSSLFIQNPRTLTTLIQRPADLFTGNISNLLPQNLHVRREHQSFRVLPRTGAVVMTTRTQLERLVDVLDKEGLWREIEGWEEDEAVVKGRDLWEWGVRAWCKGEGEGWRDDRTVVGSESGVGVGR